MRRLRLSNAVRLFTRPGRPTFVFGGISVLALSVVHLVSPREALAVRPFVTDDARIIDEGQIEIEMWPEVVRAEGETNYGFHLVGGVTVAPWLELLAGSGVGLDADGGLAIANPVFLPKFLVWPAELTGVPGLSIGTGVTLPWGQGSLHDDAAGTFAAVILTSRLANDWVMLHANAGYTSAHVSADRSATGRAEHSVRPYWGVGFDIGVVHEDVRIIGEAYAGDPFEPLSPDLAFQYGMRWLATDHLNLDITLGTQPVDGRSGEWEHWAQAGIRVLFDTFRDTPGSHEGARGMMDAPRRRARVSR
jgi:hypothetical protein